MKKIMFLVAVYMIAWQVAAAQLMGNLLSSQLKGTPIDIAAHEGDGFKAEYYNGPNFNEKVLTRIDKNIDFFLIHRSPAEGVDAGYFSVRWTGKFYAPKTGMYTFYFIADDGVRLWLNNQIVIDNWRLNRATKFSGKISLKGEQLYDLKIEYSQMKPSAAVAKASWSFENGPDEPFDPKYVFSRPPKTVPVAAKKPSPAKTTSPVAQKAPADKPAATKPVPEKTSTVAKVIPKEQKEAKQTKEPPRPAVKAPVPDTDANVDDLSKETFDNLEKGKAVVLNHIFFDQSKSELKPESFDELHKLVNTLNKYPQIKITVTGHTDNVGDFYLNVELSKDRARAVADYLVQKGVAEGRIEYKGLGGLYPLAPNTTEENKMKNRRVEFAVR
jgi:outer membrane protein OmpA-like peptidoglycan-associated protein